MPVPQSTAKWFPIVTAKLPENCGLILVTNNIEALNAYGKKSHVWLTTMLHESEEPGEFHCFPEPFDPFKTSRVYGLTHWRPALPEEWPDPESRGLRTGTTMRQYLLSRGTEITDPSTGHVYITPCDCRPTAVDFDVEGEYDDDRMIYRGHAIVTLKTRVVHAHFRDVKEIS